jgi:hypothetical protein
MFLKKLLIASDGQLNHISWTKVGATVCGIVGAIVTAGVCPPAALPYAKALLSIFAAVGIVGARDAIGK